jgi:acyl carrier protein
VGEVTTKDRVRAFITEFFYVSDPASLTDDLSLIDSGLVDSTGMMDVIVFLESEYGFHVEDDEMIPENLESIDLIAGFVRRKIGRSSSPELEGSGEAIA